MMLRTHLLLSLAVGLLVLQQVVHQVSFIVILLLATMLPDIDSAHSFLGKYKFFRPLQWFCKHRGFFHSLTFCILVTGFFTLFVPIFALPFFMGYGLHLFGDGMTIEGIRPWWPLHSEVQGNLRTGGRVESIIFVVLCVASAFLVVRLIV